MSSPSKRKGTAWETDLRDFLRPRFGVCERLTLNGAKDEGDLWFPHGGDYFVIEAKAEQRINLAGYMDEVQLEASNFANARHIPHLAVHPVAIVKRRMHNPGRAYTVMELSDFVRLVKGP